MADPDRFIGRLAGSRKEFGGTMTDGPRTPRRTLHVEANGQILAVTEYEPIEPAVPPLVLLHGIGSRAVSWWPVVDALASRFHLYAPDLRGHGGSAKPANGYLLPDYAADLAAFLDALGLERPRLLGHSLGGLVALRWAVDHPDRAAAIALEDTSLSGGARVAPAFDGWLALSRLSIEEAAAYYAREHPDWSPADRRRRAESITSTAPGVFEELRDEALRPNPPDRLAGLEAIRSPVLLVHGDLAAGGMVVPAEADRFVEIVGRARSVRIPGAGHNLHRDATGEFLAAVVPFLLDT
jgi:pimeloyl-ACP methyl ester carboxylesterase